MRNSLLTAFLIAITISGLALVNTVHFCIAQNSGSNWPTFYGDVAHSGFNSGTAPNSNNTLWIFSGVGGYQSIPAVDEGKVFVGSTDGKISAVDVTSGNLIWAFQTTPHVDQPPRLTVAYGAVYACSYPEGRVYALNESTGSRLWDFQAEGVLGCSPTANDELLYVPSQGGYFYALDAHSGAEKWKYPIGTSTAVPAAADGKVFIADWSGFFAALDAYNGQLIWKTTLPGVLATCPTVSDGKVFIMQGAPSILYALSEENGKKLWSFTPPNVPNDAGATAAVAYGKVYIAPTWTNRVYAVDETTGLLIWQSSPGPYDALKHYGALAVADDKVLAPIGSHLFALSAATGSTVWNYDMGGYYSQIECQDTSGDCPAVACGIVFIGAGDKLFAIGGNLNNTAPITPGNSNNETLVWSQDTKLESNSADNDLPASTVYQNKLYVVWQSNRDGNQQLYLKTFDGTSWSETAKLTDDPAEDGGPRLVVYNNLLYMFFHSNKDDPNRDIYYMTFDGATWSRAVRAVQNSGTDDFCGVATYNGNLYLAWTSSRTGFYDVYCKVYEGNKWSADTRLTDDPSADLHPSLASFQGKLYLQWHSPGYGAPNWEVFYKTFDGAYWSPPTQLTLNPAINEGPGSLLAVGDILYLSFSSSRDGNKQIYVDTLQNGQWQGERRLTFSNATEWHSSLAFFNDKLYAFFESDREGNAQIYYKTLENNASSVTGSQPSAPLLTLRCTSTTSLIGFRVQIDGNLTKNNTGIPNAPILLSYSVTGGSRWIDLTLVDTDTNGNYLVVWAPAVTGNFQIKATYVDNETPLQTSTTVNLVVTPYLAQNPQLFSVASNSTVSNLAFNSTSQELSFTVTGPTGTTGYVEVCIAKSLIQDPANLKVYLDEEQLNYTSTQTEESWIIYFTYHHSTHTVTLNMGTTQLKLFQETTVTITATVAVLTAIIGIAIKRRKHHKTKVTRK